MADRYRVAKCRQQYRKRGSLCTERIRRVARRWGECRDSKVHAAAWDKGSQSHRRIHSPDAGRERRLRVCDGRRTDHWARTFLSTGLEGPLQCRGCAPCTRRRVSTAFPLMNRGFINVCRSKQRTHASYIAAVCFCVALFGPLGGITFAQQSINMAGVENSVGYLASGTSIEPKTTSESTAMIHGSVGNWTAMLHANAFLVDVQQNGARGRDKLFST